MMNPVNDPDSYLAFSSKVEQLPNGSHVAYPTNDNLRNKVIPGVAPSARGATNLLSRNVKAFLQPKGRHS
jgi:hypothetical protein